MTTLRLAKHLGWRTFVAPRIVECWDSTLQQTFALRPKDVALAPLEERLNLSEKVSNVFQRLGPRWTSHFEMRNVELQRYQTCEWSLSAPALLDAERKEMCTAAGQQFEMLTFLTLAKAPKNASGALSRALTTGHQLSAKEQEIERFQKEVDEVRRALDKYIGVETMGDDRTATYLKSTVSTVKQRVNADDHDPLNETLPDGPFIRGFGVSRLGDKYVSVMTLGGFPRRTHPQLLMNVSKLPFEFRWVTRWQGMEREAAKKLMGKREETARGQTRYAKDLFLQSKRDREFGPQPDQVRIDREQKKRADDAAAAMETLSDRGYGHQLVAFVVPDENKSACEDKAMELATVLRDAGLVVRNENIDSVGPWLMSLPGNRSTGRRTYAVKTRNLVDFMPTSALFRGAPYDAALAKSTGVKRAWLQTGDAYNFNTDTSGGAAHSIVFGRTGEAGKSTFINTLGLQFLGWPNAQVISFSVGRSELGPCLMSNGAVYAPGDRTALAMQPLAYVDDPSEALTAFEWLQLCVESLGERVTKERASALEDAIKALASEPQRRRRMTDAVSYLNSRMPDLAETLRPFTHQGVYGHIFDGDNAQAWEWRPWTMIDLTTLVPMNNKASAPALAHLLHRTTKRFDGRPTLVVMDEIAEWMHKPGLEPWTARVLNTERKREVRAMLVAQSPSQLQERLPGLLASIKTSVVSRIYGPDSFAVSQKSAFAEMEVTDVQLETIKSLKQGQFLHVGKTSGKTPTPFARVFSYNPPPIGLALCGSHGTDDLAFLAGLQAKGCDGDEVLRELLARKGLSKQAEKFGSWKKNATPAQQHAAE